MRRRLGPSGRRGYGAAMAVDKNKRGTALSVNMPMAMAQAVYQQVRDGHFDSAGAVIRAALRQFLQLDDDDQPPARG
jgi:hypothetical protein